MNHHDPAEMGPQEMADAIVRSRTFRLLREDRAKMQALLERCADCIGSESREANSMAERLLHDIEEALHETK